jgi:hypothetical protein
MDVLVAFQRRPAVLAFVAACVQDHFETNQRMLCQRTWLHERVDGGGGGMGVEEGWGWRRDVGLVRPELNTTQIAKQHATFTAFAQQYAICVKLNTMPYCLAACYMRS